jgi:DNA-directed RNA polymerase specialized sigma24 family protein
MTSFGSVTRWLGPLKEGDRAAAQKLWEGYFARLVGLARAKLYQRRMHGGIADEEDVALSAFDSFCRGAEQGRFPRLDDRNDLWQLLVLIARRKVSDLVEYEERDKRDRRRTCSLDSDDDVRQLLSGEPDPAVAAEVAEQYRRLLDGLEDDELREIAELKMEGHTNEEIAAKLPCALSTVERRLRLIRKCLEEQG